MELVTIRRQERVKSIKMQALWMLSVSSSVACSAPVPAEINSTMGGRGNPVNIYWLSLKQTADVACLLVHRKTRPVSILNILLLSKEHAEESRAWCRSVNAGLALNSVNAVLGRVVS